MGGNRGKLLGGVSAWGEIVRWSECMRGNRGKLLGGVSA